MPTIDDYKNFLATIRKQTGLEMLVPDDDGLLTFRVDDEYNVNLQFIAAIDLCPSSQPWLDVVCSIFISLCRQQILHLFV